MRKTLKTTIQQIYKEQPARSYIILSDDEDESPKNYSSIFQKIISGKDKPNSNSQSNNDFAKNIYSLVSSTSRFHQLPFLERMEVEQEDYRSTSSSAQSCQKAQYQPNYLLRKRLPGQVMAEESDSESQNQNEAQCNNTVSYQQKKLPDKQKYIKKEKHKRQLKKIVLEQKEEEVATLSNRARMDQAKYRFAYPLINQKLQFLVRNLEKLKDQQSFANIIPLSVLQKKRQLETKRLRIQSRTISRF